jgi:hypothetical protein
VSSSRFHNGTKPLRRLAIALAITVTGLAVQSAHSPTTLASPSLHVCAAASCAYHHIQDAIDHASGNTIIYVDPGTYSEKLSVPGGGTATYITLWANTSATVDGGSACPAALNGPVLTVDDVTVVLHNINLTHGSGSDGGGIAMGGATVSLQGTSSVYNNCATDTGGGIFNESGTLTLHNSSSVHDNQATFAGGGIANVDGSTATLEDTSSVYNNSTADAPIPFIKSTFKIKPAQFPFSLGGGIANDGSVLALEDSSTVHDNGAVLGGGILNGIEESAFSTLIVQDRASVHHNLAFVGGGIANNGFSALIEITQTTGGMTVQGAATVHDNLAVLGGGIANGGNATLKNTSSVYLNHAFDEGGGVFNGSFQTFIPFQAIKSNVIGPAQQISGSPQLIVRDFSTVHDNAADSDGGGIYDTNGGITSSAIKPAAPPRLPPFGVILEGSGSVYHNIADDGGGIYNESSFYALLDDSTIHDNTAIFDGGGIYSDFGESGMFDRSSIYHNSALSGGGVYQYDSFLIMTGHSSIHDNSATGLTSPGFCCGGGVANVGGVIGSQLELYDYAAIYRNTAYDGAGVDNIAGSSLILNGLSSIDHNAASHNGGGINTSSGSVTLFDTSSLSYNTAGVDGGGVDSFSSGVSMNNGSSMHHNTAGNNGGGVNATSVSGIILNNTSTIRQNKAGADGGGVFDDLSGNTIAPWGPGAVTLNTPDDIS